MVGEILGFSRALLNVSTSEEGSERHCDRSHAVDTRLADIGKWLVNKFSGIRIHFIHWIGMVIDGNRKSDGG